MALGNEASEVVRQMANTVLAKACPDVKPPLVGMESDESDAFNAFSKEEAPKPKSVNP